MLRRAEFIHQRPGWDSGDGAPQYKSAVRVIIASVLGLGAILAMAGSGGTSSSVGGLVVLAGVILLVVAWRDWEFGVKALLVTVIVEGAVRKWFLSSMMVYFYKDILLAVILFGYMTRRSKPAFVIGERLKVLYAVITFLVLYVSAQAVNPSLPHPLVGLLGIKAYVFYIPLAFLIPRMFTTKEKLIFFLRWYVLIALPVACLGALQFMDTDPNSALNRYAWSEEAAQAVSNATGALGGGVATFQDSLGAIYVRITSTFSFITGLYIYLPVAFVLLLALISLRSSNASQGKIRWLYFASLGAVAVTALMTGSRGTIITMLLSAAVFFGLTSGKNFIRRLRQLALGVAVIYFAATMLFPLALDAFYTRAFGEEQQIEEGRERILNAFNLPFTEAAYGGAFGYGAGATQNGIPALMNALGVKPAGEEIPIQYEAEAARVVLDLGVVGYLLHALLRYTLLLTLIGVSLSLSDPESRVLAVAALSVLAFLLIFGGAVVSHTHNVYQWFLAGIPLALLNAERLALRRDLRPRY